MKHSFSALLTVFLFCCGSDAIEAGRKALEKGDYKSSITQLSHAIKNNKTNEEVTKLYKKALVTYLKSLQQPTVSIEACDDAVNTLSSISGFAEEEPGISEETSLFNQALLCSARHRARQKKIGETAKIIVEGMKNFPGFDPGSPVLAKALGEQAENSARRKSIIETTALAQVIFSAGKQGYALSLLDILVVSGANSDEIFSTLQQRTLRAPTSKSALGLAAGFATWHGHAAKAREWYGNLLKSLSKIDGSGAKKIHRYATLRESEASYLAQAKVPKCQIISHRIPIAKNIPSLQTYDLALLDNGVAALWMESPHGPNQDSSSSAKNLDSPQQNLKMTQIKLDGKIGKTVTLAKLMPTAPSDQSATAAYALKNREPSLQAIRCGEFVEIAGRGAPRGSWVRAALTQNGSIASKLAPANHVGNSGNMPRGDVWWNTSCSNNQLIHIWLADTQDMRLAWFAGGQSLGDPTQLRLPGFAPWFVATSQEEGATFLSWIDIMGEDRSQILSLSIPENRAIPTGEDDTNPAYRPLIENIDARVEHLRLSSIGNKFALSYYPQKQDIMMQWVEKSGQSAGSATSLVKLREDARNVLFDSYGTSNHLVTVWTETLSDNWAALFIQSQGPDGSLTTQPQRLTGLVKPGISPVIVGQASTFAIAWIDRSNRQGESLQVALVQCGL